MNKSRSRPKNSEKSGKARGDRPHPCGMPNPGLLIHRHADPCYVPHVIKDDHEMALLNVRGVTKSFAGVQALRGVDLEVLAGEVHCVLGQNGAGKSTLIKILAGVHRPDSGDIAWQGEPTEIPDPESAIHLGIATMYQELDVVDGLTIAENIFLGHEISRGGFSRRSEAARQTRALLGRPRHRKLSPATKGGPLSGANKQRV